MHSSPSADGFAARRVVALVFVGLLVSSGVVGVLGSSGITAAQQADGGENTTTTGNTTASSGDRGGNNSTTAAIEATIQEFRQNDLGWDDLSSEKQANVRSILRDLHENSSAMGTAVVDTKVIRIGEILISGFKRNIPFTNKWEQKGQVKQIVRDHINTKTSALGDANLPDFNIRSLMAQKLRSIANTFLGGAGRILTNVYDLAFSTPVPENSGWQSIFGTPTNDPFQPLYQQLLVDRLYPVTNYLLGIGVMVLGVSVIVNPLMSRFQAIDHGIKFVTFLLLYAFTWPAITLMHGITNDITMWIRPSAEEMAALVETIGAIEAGAIGAVGAYFAGAGGILATVFSLGIELALRQIALKFFFPYVFPALVLLVYLSPWQRLRAYASMGIWQYVNLLTMVIPMAIVLKAAAIAGVALDGSGVVVMLTVIALFLVAAGIPFVSTYFFIQMAGSAKGYVTSAAGGAASRVGSAKDKIGSSGGDESSSDSTDSSDSTATATTSPGDRAQAMVGSVRASDTSHSAAQSRSVGEFGSSTEREHDATDSATTTEHDAADSTTTAGKIRALHEKEKRDSMDPREMKTAYFGQSSSHST